MACNLRVLSTYQDPVVQGLGNPEVIVKLHLQICLDKKSLYRPFLR